LNVEEPSADDEGSDDYISDPDEDTLAGQMAAMRGGPVKKIRSKDSDDESSTDDDKESTVDSDSDSD
jgi:translocation protein SEC63